MRGRRIHRRKQGFGLRCLQHTGRAIQKLVQCTSNGFIRGTLNLEPWTMAIDSPSLTRLREAERTALRRDAIGFVFQAFHILLHLDLARNVAFPLILQKQPRTSALERAGEMLHAVGLGDRRSSYPRELSGGELQRVAIARALVHAPRLSSSSRSQLPERTSPFGAQYRATTTARTGA